MTGDILKAVVASGASKATTCTRVYVASLLVVCAPLAALMGYGYSEGSIGLGLVKGIFMLGFLMTVAALPMLLIVAIACVLFGGLK